jgi:threonine/homoserine/homoserine lactone efflux protein
MLSPPMFDPAGLLAAGLVCVAGAMSPGPNFIAVTHRAVSAPCAVLSSAGAASLYRRGKPWIECSCGLLLIGCGLR